MAFSYTTSTQASGFAQATLVTFINGVMTTDLGFTQIDSYTSGSEFRVYSYATNGNAKGTFILRIEISATQIIAVTYDTWNSGTHTGTSPGSASSLTWSNATSAVADKFVGAEGRFAILINNSNKIVIGYMKPATISTTTWPESTYRHCYLPGGTNLATMYISAGPAGATSASMNSLNLTSVGAATWAGTKRQVWGPKCLYNGSAGVVGWFTDVAETGLNGIAYGDIIQVSVGVEEYFVVGASGNSAVVRII